MSAYGNMDARRKGLPLGLVGQRVRSGRNAESVVIPFGVPVYVKNTESTDAAYLGDSTDATRVFAGVAVTSHRSTSTSSAEAYAVNDQVNILDRGLVTVEVASTITGVVKGKAANVYNLTSDGNYGK